jgi:hypothetical protein
MLPDKYLFLERWLSCLKLIEFGEQGLNFYCELFDLI